jgi:hypothetical protein
MPRGQVSAGNPTGLKTRHYKSVKTAGPRYTL